MAKPESRLPAPTNASNASAGALRWTRVETVAARNGGSAPTRRSGHSLSVIGSNGYLFGGCDHREPPGPTNDLFVLRIGAQTSGGGAPWEWEKLRFAPGTAPPPRWKHSATVVDGKVYVFGGFQNSTTRFNDVWIFNPITMDWAQPADKSGGPSGPGGATATAPSAAGAASHRTSVATTRTTNAVVPAPRGGHSAVAIRKSIYVFGGYGGAGYGRRDFDDLHALRCDDASWSRVTSKGRPPEKRAGHQACAVDDVMLVCGGWNSVMQFNDLHVFDTRTNAWTALEGSQMGTALPRWNHAACAVAAIPYAKVFTFGGVLGEPGNYNSQGTFTNDVAVLDSGDLVWTTPEIQGEPPCGRADSTLAYDDKGSRLLVVGGWANVWLNDVYCLDVSCVVGPPYGVTSVFPTTGPSTGGTHLVLEGIDLRNKPVTVRFACRLGAVDAAGEFVDDHTLTVTTPDFTAFPPGDVQVRVALLGDSFTTTFQTFTYFAVTYAPLCFAYGPGLLCGGASGEPTSFIIQARDAARGLRTGGGDAFTVEVYADGAASPLYLPTLAVQDLHNGRYVVTYTVPAAGEYSVHVAFDGTFGGVAGPIRKSPHVVSFDDTVTHEMNLLTGKLVFDQVLHDLHELQRSSRECSVGLEQPLSDPSWTPAQATHALLTLKEHVFLVEKRGEDITLALDELRAELAFLHDAGLAVATELETLSAVELAWREIQRKVPAASARIAPLIAAQSLTFRAEMDTYSTDLVHRNAALKTRSFWSFAVGAQAALSAIADERAAFDVEDAAASQKRHTAKILECPELLEPIDKALTTMRRTLEHAQQLWTSIASVTRKLELAKDIPWRLIDGAVLEEEAKAFVALVKSVHKDIRDCDAYKHFERLVRDFQSTCPLFQALRHPSMRRRHWQALADATGQSSIECPDDNPELRFADVLALDLHACQRDVEEITDSAQKEAKQETALQDLEARWAAASFAMTRYRETTTPLLHLSEDTVEMLEADQLLLQAMAGSGGGQRQQNHFYAQATAWTSKLGLVADVTAELSEIERAWAYLEPLFVRSDEVKRELPDDAARFAQLNARVQQTLELLWTSGSVVRACELPDLLLLLTDVRARLETCQQALTAYLDAKRRLFPRFYFVSEADLLDVLSTGSNSPESVLGHLEKFFLATRTLVLTPSASDMTTGTLATHFVSNDDVASERIAFEPTLELSGKVEVYLQALLEAMQRTLEAHVVRSTRRFPEQNRVEWLVQKLPVSSELTVSDAPMDAAQIALLVAGVEFANSVEHAFALLTAGRATAMTELAAKLAVQLADLVRLTQSPVSKPDRQRVMCLITADAHARDVVQTLVSEHTTAPSAFVWQAQLKHRRSDQLNRTYLEICDATFTYGFEYLGNRPRLVVTPLTDRIYVTATQALHLQMGCAPSGPAGTGKTETTKDLASLAGKACYVFNCSPEMDYKNLGNIFKGLASAGAWGCFDEFNRLAPDVLSVCSVQFKAVCDAIRADSDTVTIDGDSVHLDATCGTFVTMNPGYLGRSELPEGLKALFRPITVMAPDLVLIIENMLMAEGFHDAKRLASKFDSLYALLRELLSKQDHYDWGLRAVKSVLVVAGTYKRAEPKLAEPAVLLRSLRDFNQPKLAQQDLPVFRGLLDDLFPGVDPPRRVDEAMETFVHAACEERGLWPHEPFRLKVVQLDEVLAIRHCVFVMGPPGSGKTECCETLVAARRKKGDEYYTKVVVINPKTMSTEELYGCMVLGSREWKDGLLSKLLRDMAASAASDTRPKWLVLDGDLDANWIESMNSVMDDNRMLTLASNERIPLKPSMRLVFEIRDLQFATPATVSRAGILYISSTDGAQWRAFLASWVSTKGATVQQRTVLGEAVTRYVDPSVAFVRQHCASIVPMEGIALVQTYLYFLDAVLDAEALADAKKVDILCGFLAIWAFGAALTVADDGTDYRKVFSEWWRSEFKHVKVPTRDTVFDYYLNPTTLGFDSWRASPHFRPVRYDGSTPMASITVPTPETAAITNWMSLMVRETRPFMLVGGAGTGKTQLVQGVLVSLADTASPARTSSVSSSSVLSIHFNYYTSASSLQLVLESALAKRVGTTFGPTSGGHLVYFLDDVNLPMVDAYNTQSALALLRQYLDYGLWYDRTKFSPKHIQHVQFLACMNPSAGSLVVNPRLQRHFVTFALPPLSAASLHVIYATFLDGFVADFVEDIRKLAAPVLKAALGLHAHVGTAFRKTAVNFHYEFNLRHVANVVQGLLLARPATFEDPVKFALLWVHESTRVYSDRLVTPADQLKFTALVQQQARKCFPSFNFTRYFVPLSSTSASDHSSVVVPSDPILFAHIANGLRSNEYDQVASVANLQSVVEDALSEYNDAFPRMDLVLFPDALEHVVRIVRILSNPSGHALLVGVGGSGRKSLARLAAFVSGSAVVEVAITHAYSLLDFKADLQRMVTRAAVQSESLVFLFSDSQIQHERMLVLLNDLLASGSVPDLFTADEQTNLVQQVLPRANAALAAVSSSSAFADVSETARCWRWLVQETKRNLHVVLCFSPATPAFRQRARRFPALVNCTLIDWFQPWPSDALHSVAARFVSAESDPVLAACIRTTTSASSPASSNLVAVVQRFLPFAFESTTALAVDFFRREQRCVYATPKSFLECLALFRELLARQHERHERAVTRLASGLEKMDATRDVVATMERELVATLAEAEAKRALAEELAGRLQTDKDVVERETVKANTERAACAIIQADVAAKKADTEADLAQAQPMVDAAMAALDTLSKKDLGSCKTMSKPPAGVGDVFGAVVVLFAGLNANIVVQKNGRVKDKDRSWDATKKALLGNVNAFVDELKGFKLAVDDGLVPEANWREVRPFLQLEHFSVETIEKRNSAAAGLCAWVINIVAYYDAIVVVEPKKKALAEATEKLRSANDTLARVNDRLAALEAQLAVLTDEFERTTQAVQAAVAAVERGRLRIELATRLTAALGSESERWTHELEALHERANTLVCDVLVAASFVSYIGAFTKPFRDVLLTDQWVPFLRKALGASAITMTATCANPLDVLASDADVAEWTSRGLPSDRVSVENAVIARNSRRWPVLVDPQLQGLHWLRESEKHARRAQSSASFQVVRQDQPDLPQLLEAAVERGHAVLVENLSERIEPCLWSVIGRATTTRGRKTFLTLGDKLVELHVDFRLYLHTKLSNPHYPPELHAEAAVITFAVTQQGLEDQLLALVVRNEWPRKARARTALLHQQSGFKVRLQALEDRILTSLADAEGDVTENVQVIEDLEATKAAAVEIAHKAATAATYEAQLHALAVKYAPVASRGALLFFLLDGLARLHPFYVFSLNAFVVIFQRGLDLEPTDGSSRPVSGGGGGLLSRLKAAAKKVLTTQRFQWNTDLLLADRVVDTTAVGSELALEALLSDENENENDTAMPTDAQIAARCAQLKARVTDVVFNYVRRGCFEADKLALATQLCFAILLAERKMERADVQQLVTAAPVANDTGSSSGSGVLSEWLSDALWRRVRRLEASVASLQKLTTYMKADADEWREWFDADSPERKPLPGPYRTTASPLQVLHIVRVLRPDRTLAALEAFVTAHLGASFTQQPPLDMEAAYYETSASTPMLFVLFPGVDPTAWVERLGRKFDVTAERGNLVNLSMGQGQEAAADRTLLRFAREGGWVVLQNVHLMQAWLPSLERTLELASVSADPNFRCFLSAEPPATTALSNLPESLLQSCIKVANEAPTDLKSNLRRVWANFSLQHIATSARPSEYQGCLFALCVFHALVLGRRRFGAQGWSRPYSFNTGDLLICADVLRRYLERPLSSKTQQLPWDDLRYIFGEIMYGGHITDHWDRITCNAYLSSVFTPGVLTGAELAPGINCPDPAAFTYTKYASYIDCDLPAEAPAVYGLHPNAEIGYLVAAADRLFAAIQRFEPLTTSGSSPSIGEPNSAPPSGSAGPNVTSARVVTVVESLLERLPAEFELETLQARAAPLLTLDHSPYAVVALQEAARMNVLVSEVRTSLSDLLKGLSGALSMTEAMDDLVAALTANQVPGRDPLHRCSWERVAWSSRKPLGSWFTDFLARTASLATWVAEFELPYSVWLAGLFNPTAFLTAIKQCTARQHGLALDSLTIETHCTALLSADAAETYPERGAFVHGLYFQGARWEPPSQDKDKDKDKDAETEPTASSLVAYEVDGVVCGGHVTDPAPKELFPPTPVVYARAVAVCEQWEATRVGYFRRDRDVVNCPVYQTTQRGPTFVFLATLHTVALPHKWVLAGLALVLQRDDDA